MLRFHPLLLQPEHVYTPDKLSAALRNGTQTNIK